MTQQKLDAEYWNERYLSGRTGWDMQQVSPPLKAYIDQLDDKNIRILVPGCGNAHEAAYLLSAGFTNVTLIDFAPAALEAVRKKLLPLAGTSLHLICENFFDVHSTFDLVLEQTFFCAIDPSLRTAYVQHMHSILVPGGRFAGLLFDRDFEGGPPFGGTAAEYKILFAPFFYLRLMEPCYNSVPPRMGHEVFVIFENKMH